MKTEDIRRELDPAGWLISRLAPNGRLARRVFRPFGKGFIPGVNYWFRNDRIGVEIRLSPRGWLEWAAQAFSDDGRGAGSGVMKTPLEAVEKAVRAMYIQ